MKETWTIEELVKLWMDLGYNEQQAKERAKITWKAMRKNCETDK